MIDSLPILGAVQAMVALGYVIMRRRCSFASGLAAVLLFASLALAVFEGPGAAAAMGLSGSMVLVASLAWAMVPPLAVQFSRQVMGAPGDGLHALALFTAIPAALLAVVGTVTGDACLIPEPCASAPWLSSVWGALSAAACLALLVRMLLRWGQMTGRRPFGRVRLALAFMFAVILALRLAAEASVTTGAQGTGDIHGVVTIGWVLALNFITLLVFRLYPEPAEAMDAKALESEHVNRFRRHLAQAVVFEEGGVGTLVRGTVLTTIVTVMALLAWTMVTPVKESAVTFGAVVPLSNVRQVQHLEGGIVAEVRVREGQLVAAGEVLARLDPAQAVAELEQIRAREMGLSLKAERLRAFAEGRAPEFAVTAEDERDAAQAHDQGSIFVAQTQAQETGRAVLEAQIQQRQADIALFQRQLTALEPQIALISKEVAIRGELAAKGLTSQVVFLNTQRELERLKGERARLQGQLGTAGEALGEAERRRLDLDSKLVQDALNEMGTVTAELAQLRESRSRLEDRVSRLEIVAPVRGLVQELSVTSPGQVIQQGGMVTKIVPVDDVLMVENQITPRDIGHVKPGQPVRVKVTAYDFARFGAVDGTLIQVSPTTFLDEKKNPYYKGMVALTQTHLGDNPDRNRILPGMTVQVDVVTGEKTILQYLLKPIYVAASQAFRER